MCEFMRCVPHAPMPTDASAAGMFERFPMELLVALVARLLDIPDWRNIDRFSRARPNLARRTARDTMSLMNTCKWIRRCCHAHDSDLRLEALSRMATRIIPDGSCDHPYLQQILKEQRSLERVKVLKDAARHLVIHCSRDHCDPARRRFNTMVASDVYQKGYDTTVLKNRAIGCDVVNVHRVAFRASSMAAAALTDEVALVQHSNLGGHLDTWIEGYRGTRRSTSQGCCDVDPTYRIGALAPPPMWRRTNEVMSVSHDGTHVACLAIVPSRGSEVIHVYSVRESNFLQRNIEPPVRTCLCTCRAVWFFDVGGTREVNVLWQLRNDRPNNVVHQTCKTMVQEAAVLPNVTISPSYTNSLANGEHKYPVAVSDTGRFVVLVHGQGHDVVMLQTDGDQTTYRKNVRNDGSGVVKALAVTEDGGTVCACVAYDLRCTVMIICRSDTGNRDFLPERVFEVGGWVAHVELALSPCSRFAALFGSEVGGQSMMLLVDLSDAVCGALVKECVGVVTGSWRWHQKARVAWNTGGIWLKTTGVLFVGPASSLV